MVSLTAFIRRSVFRAMHAKLLVWRYHLRFFTTAFCAALSMRLCQPFQDFNGERVPWPWDLPDLRLSYANSFREALPALQVAYVGRQPFRLLRFFQCDRMRPRLFKAQAQCFLFSFLLRLRGNDGSQMDHL